MGKRFKERENKAFYINAIEYAGQKLVSIRQQYTTQKEPDVWKNGMQGVSLPAKSSALRKFAAYLVTLADKIDAEELEFLKVEPKQKEEAEKPKAKAKAKK